MSKTHGHKHLESWVTTPRLSTMDRHFNRREEEAPRRCATPLQLLTGVPCLPESLGGVSPPTAAQRYTASPQLLQGALQPLKPSWLDRDTVCFQHREVHGRKILGLARWAPQSSSGHHWPTCLLTDPERLQFSF